MEPTSAHLKLALSSLSFGANLIWPKYVKALALFRCPTVRAFFSMQR